MIGYYAHHHGSGHVTRASSIARAVQRRGESTTVLSSRNPLSDCTADEWIALPLDVAEGTAVDPTADELLHWAPIGVDGLAERMALIANWVSRARPRLMVVDVSVEVALFVRLTGTPVVVVAMPGERDDAVHRLAYRAATAIIAPWSQDTYDPAWLHPYAHKTFYTGAISRFEGREPLPVDRSPNVVVLGGAGGSALTRADVERAAATAPRYRWRCAGVDSATWVDDVWPLLCAASVVVTHAGQNAIADIACAARPAVVVPQDRPFGEQVVTGAALAAAGAAVVTPQWPARWSSVLDAASAIDPVRWQQLRTAGAAERAAAVLVDKVLVDKVSVDQVAR